MDDLEGFSSEEDETRAWRVSKSGRKRDLTDISHSTFSREDQNNKRVLTRSLRTRWASSGNATTTMWKQYRLPPEAHHSFGDHGITSVKGALCTYDDTTRRTMMSDLEDLEESTATTNSTSNQVKHTRSNTAAGTTGATGITSNIQLKRKGDNCGQGNHTMLLDDARVEDPESDTFLFSRPATLPSTLPRKKKRRSFPSSFDSSINRKYFIMDVETPFFAVLEALQPASCGEDHRDSTEFPHISTAHDHALPQAARVLELPAISLFGVWVAELHKRDTTTRMAAEDITSLGSSILLLRHHSHATLSSLKCYHQEAIVPDTLAISAIHPQLSRQTQIDSQHIRPADEINHKKSDRNFFISSISIAGFQGFTCSTDFNMNATRVGASILEGLEEDLLSRSEQAVFPALQSIAGATRPIGISVLCDFDMTCDYTIWIGQDLTLQSTPIVAIDGQYN